MRRMIVALVITIVALSNTATFAGTPQQDAAALARDYVAPLTSPDTRRVAVRVVRCRPLAAPWTGCRVHVAGAVRCNLVVRTRTMPDPADYGGWVPRIRCG